MRNHRNRFASPLVLLLAVAVCVSCSGPYQDGVEPRSQPENPSIPAPKPSAVWYDPATTRHDFGPILAGSDVSRSHTFRIANVSGHPVRIRGVANQKPCCGDVASIPAAVVGVGQSIEVTVTLHLGLAAGRVDHFAVLETEGGDDSAFLRTSATAIARATVEDIGPIAGPLEPGQSRRIDYSIRSVGVEGDPPLRSAIMRSVAG